MPDDVFEKHIAEVKASNDCDDSYSATMELLDDDTLLMVFDGVTCYGDEVFDKEQEFIRY